MIDFFKKYEQETDDVIYTDQEWKEQAEEILPDQEQREQAEEIFPDREQGEQMEEVTRDKTGEIYPDADKKPFKKKEKKKRGPGCAAVVGAVVLLVAGFIFGRMSINFGIPGSKSFDNKAILSKIQRIEAYIDLYFKDEIDQKKVEEGVYHGLVNGLGDTYSKYLTTEEYEDMVESDAGEYRGIGVIVTKESDTGYVVIEQVMKNEPAYNAGVENGDILISVDGTNTRDITLSETVNIIKKGEADKVTLILLRGRETLEKVVDKKNIIVESVESEMKEDGIGYVSVSSFIENTDEHFINTIDNLEKQGMRGLIIDLRDNGGGLVDTCVNMVSRIIPEGDMIVYMEDKHGRKEEYKSNSPQTVDLPVVILVNGNTASSSEIMTGCLKDYGLATVIGSKTYGKGIVQGIFPLGDGSAVELTYAGYFTPNGNDIHKKGIEPDINIEYTREEWAEIRKDPAKDTQLQKAIDVVKEKIYDVAA